MQLSKVGAARDDPGMVIVLGFFLPPVSIILMTAPIILPPLKAAGFDLVWFGVVMTIVMEMGLIHPPVGLNIFVIKNIAPDIPLSDIIWGTLPFVDPDGGGDPDPLPRPRHRHVAAGHAACRLNPVSRATHANGAAARAGRSGPLRVSGRKSL